MMRGQRREKRALKRERTKALYRRRRRGEEEEREEEEEKVE